MVKLFSLNVAAFILLSLSMSKSNIAETVTFDLRNAESIDVLVYNHETGEKQVEDEFFACPHQGQIFETIIEYDPDPLDCLETEGGPQYRVNCTSPTACECSYLLPTCFPYNP